MTSTVTFTGLGSGIDLDSMLSAMIEAERIRKISPFENWKVQWEEKIEAFQELNGKLVSFHSQVKSMDTPDEFNLKQASSTDSTVLTATAGSEALNGTHDIEVNQVAKADIRVHDGLADESSIVTDTDGIFKYSYSGDTTEIDVAANTTLSQLVNLINSDPDNPGVRASILNTGTGATPYRLVLTGQETGSTNAIAVSDDSTLKISGVDTFDSGNFTNTQTAQDAELKVNGFPDDGTWITRSSNTISDVISGVTLSLVNNGTATLTISQDTAAIKQNIVDFISSFNEIRKYIKEQTSYDTDTDNAGVLIGNYGVDTVKNRLNNIMSSTPSGFVDNWDTYVNLTQIGIYTDAELGSETQGMLIIDDATLDDALSANPQAVSDLFSDYFTGRSRSSKAEYYNYIDGITKPGSYQVRYNNSTNKAYIKHESSSTWNEATVSADTGNSIFVTGKHGNTEAGLVVRLIDKTDAFWDGTNSADVDLKRGITGDLNTELTRLTNSETGTLAILEENYEDIISSIDTKIETEETRLELYERRLRMRFGRLEALLTRLNAQSSSISNVTEQMQKK